MTIELQIFPATLEERIKELKSTREVLLKEVESLADVKPTKGWSISEILFHLHVVEKMIPMLIQGLIASPKIEPKSNEYLEKEWHKLTKFVMNRETKIDAPAMAVPTNAPSLDKCIKLLSESRTTVLDCLSKLTTNDLNCVEMEHPVKSLNLTISGLGWLSFMAYHEMRHLEQIKEMIQNNQ